MLVHRVNCFMVEIMSLVTESLQLPRMPISGRETMRFSVASSEVVGLAVPVSERQPQELLAGEGLSPQVGTWAGGMGAGGPRWSCCDWCFQGSRGLGGQCPS